MQERTTQDATILAEPFAKLSVKIRVSALQIAVKGVIA